MKDATLQDYTQRLLRVLVHIQQNLDGDLSLETLAEVAHFSPYHFHRLFTGMTGETLAAHVRRIRLERAASRLKTTTDPVVQLAYEAGYETHEAFTRAFRVQFGLSPREFRASRSATATAGPPTGVHWRDDGTAPAFAPLEPGGQPMDVTVTTQPPRRVAFVHHVGPYHEVGAAWETLCAHLGPRGLLGPDSVFVGLCHDDPEVTPPERIRYDACVTVAEDVAPEGEIGVKTLPGGTYAVTTHRGPYENLARTYAALTGQWLPRSGHRLAHAPSLEFYLNDPGSTDPQQLLTEIHLPLVSDED